MRARQCKVKGLHFFRHDPYCQRADRGYAVDREINRSILGTRYIRALFPFVTSSMQIFIQAKCLQNAPSTVPLSVYFVPIYLL